jgi:hypothetical protein
MAVAEVAGGWQMLSAPAFAEYIREFYKTRHKEKLSRAGLEVLAIIAYKQPVSRTDVEMIRGVNSDGTVMHLLNKGLIRIAGRKEVPGRPYVYATTTQFLEYFGLRALEDLPKLEDFPALMAKANEVGDPSAGPSPDVSGENSIEDLAQARTRSDIEELQKAANMPEVQDMGEPSGQSRIMAEEPAPEGDSNEPEQAA